MNREQWLCKGAELLNSNVFSTHGEKADNVKVSVGFPAGSRGAKNSAIGQCWDTSVSAGGFNEIFISPVLEDSIKVLETLGHEMVHAIVGTAAGHKGPFKRLATSIGLCGKMTDTVAGPELVAQLESIVAEIGDFPHSELTPQSKGKKGSRLVKIQCPDCPNNARQARATFEAYGLTCGSCDSPMVAQ